MYYLCYTLYNWEAVLTEIIIKVFCERLCIYIHIQTFQLVFMSRKQEQYTVIYVET